jgi:hypothetical protein
MASVPHAQDQYVMRRIISFLFVFFCCLIPAASASTPPVRPSLSITVLAPAPDPGAPLALSADWKRNGIPWYTPPDSIALDVYSVPDGSFVAAFAMPRANGACSSDEACTYRATIAGGELPSGSLMFIATDPVSGASVRKAITVSDHSSGSSDLPGWIERERLFFPVSGLVAVLSCIMLAILIKKQP